MRAVAVVKPDQLELVDIPEPKIGPYQARIRMEAACLCNSTDRKLIEGHFPGVEQYPLLLGHETVGIVEAVGDKVRNFKVGDRVIGGLLFDSPNPQFVPAWGGFSDVAVAGDHRAMVEDGAANAENGWREVYEIQRAVPKSISVEAAVLLCTWREVYSAFTDFNLKPGQEIVIYGAGPVGLSFVKFARLRGIGKITSVDPLPEKREKALEMGADEAIAPDHPSLKKRAKPLDAVIDAVGRVDIINAALPLIKLGGSICVYGVIADRTMQVEKHLGPYNFNLILHQWPTREYEAAAQEPLVEWIQQGKIDPKEFISAEYSIEEINQAFQNSKSGIPVKTIFRF